MHKLKLDYHHHDPNYCVHVWNHFFVNWKNSWLHKVDTVFQKLKMIKKLIVLFMATR
jgi:hypothetical protein